jgi:ribosomal protein S18 acetylase RimI-like enzyme
MTDSIDSNNQIVVKRTPWDKEVFGVNTYEIIVSSAQMLSLSINQVMKHKRIGHYTIKVDPLWDSKVLSRAGFYYCDTLIQPYCKKENLIFYDYSRISLSQDNSLEELINISDNAFSYGRFHRDFNIDRQKSNLRYNLWLTQLFTEKKVWGLLYDQELVGFWGFFEESILLHALKVDYRGKGLAKYFWSLACKEMFNRGCPEIKSSISAANLAVLNLYISLGFKFRNAQDVYHLVIN